jgi:hypothetical protein
MTPEKKTARVMMYRWISVLFVGAFAAVGLLFLFGSRGVLTFFNRLSVFFGLHPSPVDTPGFFLILSVAYMYTVTVLAWCMFRNPDNRVFPMLLVHAKSASAILSLILFFTVTRTFIYLANGIMDGSLAAVVFLLDRKIRYPE